VKDFDAIYCFSWSTVGVTAAEALVNEVTYFRPNQLVETTPQRGRYLDRHCAKAGLPPTFSDIQEIGV
jgi:hypothetical protein